MSLTGLKRLSDHLEFDALAEAAKWDMTRHARGSSSRQGANTGQYFIAEISKLRVLCVLRLRERELRHQDFGRIVARTGARRNDEALHEQRRRDEHHYRQGNLRGYKDPPEPRAAFAARRLAGCFLERVIYIKPRILECRREAEDQSTKQRNS